MLQHDGTHLDGSQVGNFMTCFCFWWEGPSAINFGNFFFPFQFSSLRIDEILELVLLEG